MAIAKFGAIVTDVRGKLGGHVFQGNGFTTSLRTASSPRGTIGKHIPSNNLAGKSLIQAHNVVRLEWQALSDAERQQWSVLANQFLLPNKFGSNVALSGYALFTRNITALYYAGLPTAIDPFSATNEKLSPVLNSVTIDTMAETATVSFSGGGPAYAKILYARRARSVNEKIYPGKLQYLTNVTGGGFLPLTVYQAILSKFPGIESGMPLQFGLVLLNDFGFYTFKTTKYATYV